MSRLSPSIIRLLMLAFAATAIGGRAYGSDVPIDADEEEVVQTLSLEEPLDAPLEAASNAAPAAADTMEPTDYYDETLVQEFSESPECTDGCSLAPLNSRFWFTAEYLLWGTEGMYVPALVSTSPIGTASGQAGVLDGSSTTLLKGESHFNDDVRSGARFEFGYWLDSEQLDSIAATYFFIGQGSSGYHVDPAQNGIIARPFYNVEDEAGDARLVAYPNLVTGTVDIAAQMNFHAASVEYRRRAINSGRYKIDWLFGYQFAQLDENITIRDSTLSLSGITQGTSINLYDAFDSSNAFHGALLGLAAHEQLSDNWTGDVYGKGSIGGVASRTNITGETATTLNNVTTTNAGGLLTQTTNLGVHREGYVSSAWEFGLRARRKLTSNMSFTIGYTWFLLSHVERAGEQIDLAVNVSQIPPGSLSGLARPAFPGEKSSFWTQGISVGLESRF
ncbi:BBP7 family outer membrane beta-barrel protein [Lacipirellula parvula]|uniref:Uncharacterized protein n=1 Tax=Lacipirellula parvula TaxID=2650471 RepID=A0A5K7XEB9_9BACT|nr:BBP7 family outer membrane beta-barrel protein [Lacipirellula parvula]BBO34407.1 hypothetical protein PLANPX_4019 [Lacipirellula parvula]